MNEQLKNLHIEGTPKTPRVEFKTEGQMLISGNGIIEDHLQFFEPLKRWCNDLESKDVNIVFDLNYLNSGSSRSLFDMFKQLNYNNNIRHIHTTWYYDEGDEEMLEYAELLNEAAEKANFQYKVHETTE